MLKKINLKIFFIFLIISLIIYLIQSNSIKKKNYVIEEKNEKENSYNSNIIKDVRYITIDSDGNEYLIEAITGEIDFANSEIIYLTNVYASIKLNNFDEVKIFSDYGKYNTNNYDTIFSKNVIINYLENKITGEYLDFSLERNSMLISKNVIYSNLNSTLKGDAIEMNLKTKDTKIFTYEKEKKINIKSKR